MDNEELRPAAELAIKKAPEDWCSLKVRYRYFDDASDLKTYFKSDPSDDWKKYNGSCFDMMDVFDAYRDGTHSALDEPWSVLILTFGRTGALEVEFDYGDPGILNG